MQFQYYTLPLLALAVFVGLFSYEASTQPVLTALPVGGNVVRESLFGDPSHNTASVIDATAGDLIAYWPLDESGGVTVLDYTRNSKVGVLGGTPLRTTGKEGNGLFLDGLSDYIAVSESDKLNLPTRFSLSLWVYPEKSSPGAVLSKHDTDAKTSDGYALLIDKSRLIYGVNEQATLSGTNMDLESHAWTHVIVTFDASRTSNTRLYVNGKRIVSGDLPAPDSSDGEFLIGRSQEGIFFSGGIDEVRIYNRALSDTEVTALYEVYQNARTAVQSETEEGVAGFFERIMSSVTASVLDVFRPGLFTQ